MQAVPPIFLKHPYPFWIFSGANNWQRIGSLVAKHWTLCSPKSLRCLAVWLPTSAKSEVNIYQCLVSYLQESMFGQAEVWAKVVVYRGCILLLIPDGRRRVSKKPAVSETKRRFHPEKSTHATKFPKFAGGHESSWTAGPQAFGIRDGHFLTVLDELHMPVHV